MMFWGAALFKEDISSEKVSLCRVPVAFSTRRRRYFWGEFYFYRPACRLRLTLRACCEAISGLCYLPERFGEV